jgi:RNA polymerase sigma-70 factor (ECF subfamily)
MREPGTKDTLKLHFPWSFHILEVIAAATAREEHPMEVNTAEFQEIYDQFHPRILRYMKRMVGETEAEDLAQEVFAKVASSLASFRHESQLSTWIYRIATNSALDNLRSLLKAPTVGLAETEEDIPNQSVWTGEEEPTPESQVYRNEMNDCIRGFVVKFPQNYRAVLLLGEFEGLKNEQVADILDLSLDTVKIRLHRARQRLKEELAANCGPEWVDGNEFLPELRRTKI